MNKIIVIILWFLLVSFEVNKTQNVSVSKEVEVKIHKKDTLVKNVSKKVKINKSHPFTDFCNKYQPLAYYYQVKYGVPVSIQLAQAIVESGGGKSELAKKANNLFGMKYYKRLFDGEYYESKQGTKWRKYNSFDESFEDHAIFLQRFYPGAVGKNWQYWVVNCKGYGEGKYWFHISSVIDRYQLWKYDVVQLEEPKKRSYNL